ncbi:Poly-beta-1,6-N-acetyl-D-glucosamine synthase [Sarcina ventriculi]|uniref:TIGR03111 family XrtG-associated glycosyltransferase n=1 Tax=Sarcina ventriculi TaxID=1267 RepID=UPI000DA1009F|nr:TIGR03111 family XrtG-associated glycosyltransferase [Sarcina ventriculi]SPZ49382.1 Poly-beta-1,6-N-acetyl-D-glucosamine synthase [Sarcina ventriculi]
MLNTVYFYLIFWCIWLLIPLVVDGIPGFFIAFNLFITQFKIKKEKILKSYPTISIIIPVYNSASTLEACIESVVKQKYPKDKIEIFLIDNGSSDNSFEVFRKIHNIYSSSQMWWLTSGSGKVNALNKGLYLSKGDYLINIDSDGILHEDAIFNMIYDFEQDHSIYAMTGAILINKDTMTKDNDKKFLKLIQKCELYEYLEAFLVGRAYESKRNNMFTLAGAFSGFRRSAIVKTHLYNAETLGEDTAMTFEIKTSLNGKVKLCSTAYFFTDSIESIDKLYLQRQRWQCGELEVAALFKKQNLSKKLRRMITVTLIKDHTFLFSRMIWFFANIYLIASSYPLYIILISNLLLYFMYSLISVCNFIVIKKYLKNLKEYKSYYNRNFFIAFLMPSYRMFTFFMRALGAINAMDDESNWNRKSFKTEKDEVSQYIKSLINKIGKVN